MCNVYNYNTLKLKLKLRQYISCISTLEIYIIIIKVSIMRITQHVMNTPSNEGSIRLMLLSMSNLIKV